MIRALIVLALLCAGCGRKRSDEVDPARFAKVIYTGASNGVELKATALPGLRSPATGGPWGWLCIPLFFLCFPDWNVQVQLTAHAPGRAEPIEVATLYDSDYTREFAPVIAELSVASCHDNAHGKHVFRVERSGPDRSSWAERRVQHRVFTLDGVAFTWGSASNETCEKELAQMPAARAALDEIHRLGPELACTIAKPAPKLAKKYCP